VDDNVSGLRQELLALSGILEGIEKMWRQNHVQLVAYAGADASLWTSIKDNVENGRKTVTKLEKALDNVSKTSIFGRGFLRKPVKALKMNLSSDDIVRYRQRITSHHLAMQGGLQMISLCLQIQQSSSQDNLDKSLSGLESMIKLITERLETFVPSQQGSEATNILSVEHSERGEMASALQNIARAARSLHSSASTVIEGTRSTVYEGSVVGGSLTEEQITRIQGWIPPPEDVALEDSSSLQTTPVTRTPTRTPSDTPAPVSTQAAAPVTAPVRGSTDFLGRAIDTVKKAIEHDKNQEYERAYKEYQLALELFLVTLKFEKNPRSKEMIRTKMGEYLDRAEKLKNYLVQTGPKK
jgi:hypothetical protein